jgi:hypothetical protein
VSGKNLSTPLLVRCNFISIIITYLTFFPSVSADVWEFLYHPLDMEFFIYVFTSDCSCRDKKSKNPPWCAVTSIQARHLNPFTAEVATPRLSAEVAFVRPEKEEQSDWLAWPNDSFYWPRVFILQADAKSIQCFQKHAKLIENWFSRSKVQLTRVWELLTRRWNALHWESHCDFTAGGERVNLNLLSLSDCSCRDKK